MAGMFRRLLGALLLFAGAAQAQSWTDLLLGRDLNNDGTFDAYYELATNLSWLADANLPRTTGYTDGMGSLLSHNEVWAAGLDFHGVTGWRLPMEYRLQETAPVTDCIVCRWARDPGDSEMGHLFAVTLGGAGTDPFINFGGTYRTGSTMILGDHSPGSAYTFAVYYGGAGPSSITVSREFIRTQGWAVHEGDVGTMVSAVPEPSTYALMLAGLLVVGCSVRKHRQGSRLKS